MSQLDIETPHTITRDDRTNVVIAKIGAKTRGADFTLNAPYEQQSEPLISLISLDMAFRSINVTACLFYENEQHHLGKIGNTFLLAVRHNKPFKLTLTLSRRNRVKFVFNKAVINTYTNKQLEQELLKNSNELSQYTDTVSTTNRYLATLQLYQLSNSLPRCDHEVDLIKELGESMSSVSERDINQIKEELDDKLENLNNNRMTVTKLNARLTHCKEADNQIEFLTNLEKFLARELERTKQQLEQIQGDSTNIDGITTELEQAKETVSELEVNVNSLKSELVQSFVLESITQ